MSNLKQLALVADVETKREQQAAKQYQLAQQNVVDNRTKLDSLENYRLNYLKMVQTEGQQGLEAQRMTQHQLFLGKLDKACEQQVGHINKASLAAEQRKRQWLAQQKKRKAIEHLIDVKQKQANLQILKAEQKLQDELITNKYARTKALY